MVFGLDEQDVTAMRDVLARHPQVEQAVIYGSRATGRYRYNSDIDLTLMGTSLDFATLSEIDHELDDLMMPYFIDLSIFQHIDNPSLVERIQEDGKVLYEKQPSATTPAPPTP